MRIVCEHINKSFNGKPVISDFSFTFEEGKHYILSGASGTGKTTLLNLLMGLLKADSGKIIREDISFSAVFQEDRLLEDLGPVENVLAVSPGLTAEEARTALKEVLPEEELDKPVKDLSGGQKRRVAVVRALMHESSCLILDEPFTGMDQDTLEKVWDFISAHAGKRILILVSHEQIDEKRFIKIAI